jgi:hypothetical protein
LGSPISSNWIAAVADLDGQALFDQAQMLVELPAQIGEAASLKGSRIKRWGSMGAFKVVFSRPGAIV